MACKHNYGVFPLYFGMRAKEQSRYSSSHANCNLKLRYKYSVAEFLFLFCKRGLRFVVHCGQLPWYLTN